MFADLDPKSAVPLYEQIAVRLKAAVATGELNAGEALPSVRILAGKLRINPATVVQAYRALETEGFVEMRQGAGTYVQSVQAEGRARERGVQARRLIRAVLVDAARLGLTRNELKEAIRHEMEVGAP
ncbi:MAG TPA: GntR family transcriptional regulator [Gemmatimonadales bacterium]|nr:GntR family transcriptional regulator [Gemmatimonadales bacterium]